ncbi:phage antirepressor KilAC domain-containing protein [Pseudovibrio exalbescens]|uniref:phage antirepressor KilAC domain-containing protein n=1 Tax=Pseudovibrio exalbescens TaxID=197461 RepID=UPI0015E0C7A0|nr:phage antirepressor KilAC domain-containing protein [Pseudovibrio exalbescens]
MPNIVAREMNDNGQPKMSSREIAELLEMRHDNVCTSMKRLQKRELIQCSTALEEKHGDGRPATVYYVNKRDSYVVVAQLSPEFTARLVDRWQELEEQAAKGFQVPKSFREALLLAADQQEVIEKQQAQIAAAKPAVDFVGRYVEANGLKGFRDICRMLQANEREFKRMLTEKGLIYFKMDMEGNKTNTWRFYKEHVNLGRVVEKEGENNGHRFHQPKFTAKGIKWVAGMWAEWKHNQDTE